MQKIRHSNNNSSLSLRQAAFQYPVALKRFNLEPSSLPAPPYCCPSFIPSPPLPPPSLLTTTTQWIECSSQVVCVWWGGGGTVLCRGVTWAGPLWYVSFRRLLPWRSWSTMQSSASVLSNEGRRGQYSSDIHMDTAAWVTEDWLLIHSTPYQPPPSLPPPPPIVRPSPLAPHSVDSKSCHRNYAFWLSVFKVPFWPIWPSPWYSYDTSNKLPPEFLFAENQLPWRLTKHFKDVPYGHKVSIL